MSEEKLEKSITETYFGCRKCEKKMLNISLGSSSDFLGFMSGKTEIFYCDSKECEEFGRLTIVGIKIEK